MPPGGRLLDVDAAVTCSSGTYVRALARDLGQALGVGGHLTVLRRTRVGRYRIEDARTLDELAGTFTVIPLAEAAAAAFPRLDLTDAGRGAGPAHGASLPAAGAAPAAGPAASRPGRHAGRAGARSEAAGPGRWPCSCPETRMLRPVRPGQPLAAWHAWRAGTDPHRG